MSDYQMGTVESRFADIIWQNEPVSSAELAKRSEEAFGWKKSTTYTILKHLEEKGVFRNADGAVQVCLTRAEYETRRTQDFVGETFGGSLPRFLAAFTGGQRLNRQEAEQLRRFIEQYEEE